ncbi:hypothetical protein HZC53_04705 [Candidatus Uhrbacteria bacterium]|nr:hypothetical protein [Candidatus Uhrbacteria bacterium]
MYKARKISLGLLTVLACAACEERKYCTDHEGKEVESDCEQAEERRCVDKDMNVVEDEKCLNATPPAASSVAVLDDAGAPDVSLTPSEARSGAPSQPDAPRTVHAGGGGGFFFWYFGGGGGYAPGSRATGGSFHPTPGRTYVSRGVGFGHTGGRTISRGGFGNTGSGRAAGA